MLIKIKKTWLPALWELNSMGSSAAFIALKGLARKELIILDPDPIDGQYFGILTDLGKIVLNIVNSGNLAKLNQAKACRKYALLEINR